MYKDLHWKNKNERIVDRLTNLKAYIVILKELGFTILEIREIIANQSNWINELPNGTKFLPPTKSSNNE
jgi:hypothetical protein